MYETSQDFTFDAAHHLGANVTDTPGHLYSRLHGHSFSVTVTLRGEPDPIKHWLVDLAVLRQGIKRVHDLLDHHYLNEIPGLEVPTMENISHWIWQQLKPDFPQLYRISVRRGTLGESCAYQESA